MDGVISSHKYKLQIPRDSEVFITIHQMSKSKGDFKPYVTIQFLKSLLCMLTPRNKRIYTSKNCENIHVKKSKNLEIRVSE